jgi:hypothetical protein
LDDVLGFPPVDDRVDRAQLSHPALQPDVVVGHLAAEHGTELRGCPAKVGATLEAHPIEQGAALEGCPIQRRAAVEGRSVEAGVAVEACPGESRLSGQHALVVMGSGGQTALQQLGCERNAPGIKTAMLAVPVDRFVEVLAVGVRPARAAARQADADAAFLGASFTDVPVDLDSRPGASWPSRTLP